MKNRDRKPLIEHKSHRKLQPEIGRERVYTHCCMIYVLRRTDEGFEFLREHTGSGGMRYIPEPVNGENIWGANFSWQNAERAILVKLGASGIGRKK